MPERHVPAPVPGLATELRKLEQHLQQRAQRDAPGGRGNADGAGAGDDTDQNSCVERHAHGCWPGEAPVHLQDCGEEGAEPLQHQCGCHHPQEVCGDLGTLGPHVEQRHWSLGPDGNERRERNEHNAHPGEDGPQEPPRAVGTGSLALLLEYRDEQRCEHVEQDRRHRVDQKQCVDVGIGLRRGAVHTRQHDLAYEPEGAGEDSEEGDDGCRPRHLPDAHGVGASP